MPDHYIDLKPVDLITIDAIGKPGKRVFYLQGRSGNETITLLMEKVQVQSLSVSIRQMLEEIQDKHPDLPPADPSYSEAEMEIIPPVDPIFRVGELGLSFNPDQDEAILYAREIPVDQEDLPEDDDPDLQVVRFYCSRSQLTALTVWAMEVSNRGRSICPYCGQPMEPEGHFCPKKNGHKKH